MNSISDLLPSIIDFLTFEDCFHLKKTCKELRLEFTAAIFTIRLNRIIRGHLPDIDEFKKVLISSNAIIAGNVILTALLPDIKLNVIDVVISRDLSTGPSDIEKYLQNYCCNETNPSWSWNYSFSSDKTIVYGYKCYIFDKIELNLILIIMDPIKAMTSNRLDFDGLYNYYNGKLLMITNVDDVLNMLNTID